MLIFILAISCLTTSNLPWFMDLTFHVPMQHCFYSIRFPSITSDMNNWTLFMIWFHLFFLSGVITQLFSSSILGTYWAGKFIIQCHIFFTSSYCSWGSQGKNTEVICHCPMDHVLSELSTMTCPSWVALHSMAHSFIELDKAVVHLINFISLLWLWFSLCLPSEG